MQLLCKAYTPLCTESPEGDPDLGLPRGPVFGMIRHELRGLTEFAKDAESGGSRAQGG